MLSKEQAIDKLNRYLDPNKDESIEIALEIESEDGFLFCVTWLNGVEYYDPVAGELVQTSDPIRRLYSVDRRNGAVIVIPE